MVRLRSAFYGLLLVAVIAPIATADTINFDTSPNGTAISNGTDLTGASGPYSSLGVTFQYLPCTLGIQCATVGQSGVTGLGVFATTVPSTFAFSGSNVISTWTGTGQGAFNAFEGTIQANFSTAQSTVSIEASAVCNGQDATCLGINSGAAYISAFDSIGNLIGTATTTLCGSNACGTYQLLTVTGPANIAYVQFGAPIAGTLQIASFDDLTFGSATGGGGGGGGTTVPEPSSLVLFGTGMAGAVGALRRSSRQK